MMQIHSSCVAFGPRALLILGPAGSGKSTLALSLMGQGAMLVCDDRTQVWEQDGQLWADAPKHLPALIEARGVGLLHADRVGPLQLTLAVDLGRAEDQRLPPFRHREILGIQLPLVLGPMSTHLSYALRQYMLRGRSD